MMGFHLRLQKIYSGGASATTPAIDDDDSKTDMAIRIGGESAKDENQLVQEVDDDNGLKEIMRKKR
eukprot:UN17412